MNKILVVLLILVSFILPFSASAASVDSGTINSSALNYFEGIIDKLDPEEQYFIYRSGDYSATMLHGYELTLSGSVVSGSNVTQIVYNSRGIADGSYNYTPTIDYSTLESIQVSTDRTSIAYSSLGSWSTLGDQKQTDLLTYILWIVLLVLFVIIIFKFFRYRKGYISL